jgi:hypothetical protein
VLGFPELHRIAIASGRHASKIIREQLAFAWTPAATGVTPGRYLSNARRRRWRMDGDSTATPVSVGAYCRR